MLLKWDQACEQSHSNFVFSDLKEASLHDFSKVTNGDTVYALLNLEEWL